MKKITWFVLIVFAVIISLLYWSTNSTNRAFATCSLVNGEDMSNINFRDYDSVLLIPNNLYKADNIKKLVQGQQYRNAWRTPVKFPILYLDTLYGGTTVVEAGGGKQTHSLEIIDKNGITYSLRSINKDPKALIPDIAKFLNLENIIIDGISSQHPYGALLAAKLADIAGIQHTHPKAVFLPKQKALGNYNAKFGNRIFLLEYETKGNVNWTTYNNVIEIMDTDNLQKFKLIQGDKLKINKEAYIKTRLFDLLIGDWDRHGKQWGWIVESKNSNYIAHPLAGDRDNAFFSVDGLVPLLISNKYVVPEVRPFEEEIKYMPGLVYGIDRYFLLHTNKALFIKQAEELKHTFTDTLIENAFKVWPKRIRANDKAIITSKLNSRLSNLTEYALKFKATIDELGVLKNPLKGSEDKNFPTWLLTCFECKAH